MRISDWSSDVCSSDLHLMTEAPGLEAMFLANRAALLRYLRVRLRGDGDGEDILQDLWLKLADIDASLIAEPLAYLYRAAENLVRSEERRVGKECVSTCRSRWSPDL